MATSFELCCVLSLRSESFMQRGQTSANEESINLKGNVSNLKDFCWVITGIDTF